LQEDSPDRPLYQDENVVRGGERGVEEELVRSQTASRMLSLFRQMENEGGRDQLPSGPKPLKRFTPPPDYRPDNSEESEEEESDEEEGSEEEEEEEDDRIPGVIRASDKIEDDFLKSVSFPLDLFVSNLTKSVPDRRGTRHTLRRCGPSSSSGKTRSRPAKERRTARTSARASSRRPTCAPCSRE